MKKYKLIAREEIQGVSGDFALKALNGYAEIIFGSEKEKAEVYESDECAAAQQKLITDHPDNHFRQFELKEVEE